MKTLNSLKMKTKIGGTIHLSFLIMMQSGISQTTKQEPNETELLDISQR